MDMVWLACLGSVLPAAIAASLLLLLLLLVARQEECSLLFIDAPDPDNPAAAVALWSYSLKKKKKAGHLHIVLTGRPVNLRSNKRFSEHLPIRKQIARQKWETAVPAHARRVLEDSACRLAG